MCVRVCVCVCVSVCSMHWYCLLVGSSLYTLNRNFFQVLHQTSRCESLVGVRIPAVLHQTNYHRQHLKEREVRVTGLDGVSHQK